MGNCFSYLNFRSRSENGYEMNQFISDKHDNQLLIDCDFKIKVETKNHILIDRMHKLYKSGNEVPAFKDLSKYYETKELLEIDIKHCKNCLTHYRGLKLYQRSLKNVIDIIEIFKQKIAMDEEMVLKFGEKLRNEIEKRKKTEDEIIKRLDDENDEKIKMINILNLETNRQPLPFFGEEYYHQKNNNESDDSDDENRNNNNNIHPGTKPLLAITK